MMNGFESERELKASNEDNRNEGSNLPVYTVNKHEASLRRNNLSKSAPKYLKVPEYFFR